MHAGLRQASAVNQRNLIFPVLSNHALRRQKVCLDKLGEDDFVHLNTEASPGHDGMTAVIHVAAVGACMDSLQRRAS